MFSGDAAPALTKALKLAWDSWDASVTRVMCWAHTSRAIDRSAYLAGIRAVDKEIANKLLQDLYMLQWSVLNEDSFRAVFKLLEEKHSYPSQPLLNSAVLDFFSYMRDVWVNSDEFR